MVMYATLIVFRREMHTGAMLVGQVRDVVRGSKPGRLADLSNCLVVRAAHQRGQQYRHERNHGARAAWLRAAT
jgi:hypothetical protein